MCYVNVSFLCECFYVSVFVVCWCCCFSFVICLVLVFGVVVHLLRDCVCWFVLLCACFCVFQRATNVVSRSGTFEPK